MNSSYELNNYGEVFSAIVDAFKPHNIVELGCLHGYSTVHLAEGLKKSTNGIMDVYDLFEDYPHKHGKREEVQRLLNEMDYPNVKLYKMDAYEVYKRYPDNSVSLLHVDISNTGETLRRIIEQWHIKLVHGGIILFEGGSKERDEVEWMVKYNKPSIKKELESNETIHNNYVLGTYLKYPSLTMLLKRR